MATLLDRVHKRLGGLGIYIQTFGVDGVVGVEWRRNYNGEWSDERFARGYSINEVLRAILDYEDEADRRDALLEKP